MMEIIWACSFFGNFFIFLLLAAIEEINDIPAFLVKVMVSVIPIVNTIYLIYLIVAIFSNKINYKKLLNVLKI